jgi:glycosyltransferase involved in cell wall biosynthesis
MKFLFAANTARDPNAGASGCDIATILALRLLGHEVDEIWADDMPRRIRHANMHQLLELPRNFARAVSLKCKDKRFDVVQVNQPHAWLAARQHRMARRPGIFLNRSHGWETALHAALERLHLPDERAAGRRWISKLLRSRLERHNALVTRWSDGLVVCSEPDKEFIATHHNMPADRIHVFVPGVPGDFLDTPVSQDSCRWNRVLHVSNFCAPKAPEVVAAVFRSVAEALPTTQLTWVCAMKDHHLVRAMLGSSAGKVTLKDFMSRDELRVLMDSHGIFLFPSHFEGFGMVFLEAMARGMCVVGTPVGGMPSCIRSLQNGVIVELNSADRATSTVLNLLKKSSELAAISEQAALTAKQFTWLNASCEFVRFCAVLQESKGGVHVSCN